MTSDDTVGLVAFDPDEGALCEVAPAAGAEPGAPGALVVVDGDAWFCGSDALLWSIDTSTGAIARSAVACESVASDGTSLVVINGPPSLTTTFGSGAEATVDGATPSATFSFIGATRAATDGRYWYATPHAGGHLRTHDVSTGAVVTTGQLEGFAGWVWGMSVLDGVLWVLDDGRIGDGGPRRLPALRGYDPATGATVGSIELERPLGTALRGLWCEAR